MQPAPKLGLAFEKIHITFEKSTATDSTVCLCVLQLCYLSQYKGRERGVLIQLGQGPMLGHFPLGFFDEAMSNPAPPMEAPAAGSSSSS